jgi:hypothetical protein
MRRAVALLSRVVTAISTWLKSDHAPATVAAVVALCAYLANDAQERRTTTNDLVKLSYSSEFLISYSRIERLGNVSLSDFAGSESVQEALRARRFEAQYPQLLAKHLDAETLDGAMVWIDYLRVVSSCVKSRQCDKDVAGLLLAERASMIYHNMEPFILAVRRDLPWTDFGKGACEIRNLDTQRTEVDCSKGSKGVEAVKKLPDVFLRRTSVPASPRTTVWPASSP